MIEDINDIMSFQIEQKGLKLIIEISDSIPNDICLDMKRYKQVLFNLIGNAIKFTYQGFIKVKLYLKESHLMTDVSDTGIGMKQEDLTKLFKFFGKLSESKRIN